MGSNKQVFNFSKTVGRVSREIRNTSKSGRESRNVSNGVEQTNYNFSKIVGRTSQGNRYISRRGQTNNFLNNFSVLKVDKVETYQKGSNK